ncbi:hypothetical protein GCM10007100_02250 [Roseibacillus persicicus]|uniref:Uncharacterized protein n=1 Tax=Roseibacillus persicicus TaxID=454148 RepID=A0A918WDI4_9BACT|nr:hypothetical protein GCM10007100_02250 [Roseibacillus persicicus]
MIPFQMTTRDLTPISFNGTLYGSEFFYREDVLSHDNMIGNQRRMNSPLTSTESVSISDSRKLHTTQDFGTVVSARFFFSFQFKALVSCSPP